MEKPIFEKPVGASKYHWQSLSTTGGATCELCGTDYPEESLGGAGVGLATFLGKQVVVECCGSAIDVVYEEHKIAFTEQFINYAVENPIKYRWFWSYLNGKLEQVLKMSQDNSKLIKMTQNNLTDFNQTLSS